MTVLIHDSSSTGHRKWLLNALQAGHADGAIISPLNTPWVRSQGNPSAEDLIADVRRLRPQPRVLVDATTHGVLLPATDRLAHYETWSLWPTRRKLETAGDIAKHLQAVFAAQDTLEVEPLAPTITLQSPNDTNAATALDMAREAKRQKPRTIVSIAGRSSFWRSGAALDAHIGQLARVRPVGWYIVYVHDRSSYPPDLTDIDATHGWLRTIHSLTLRAPAVAAATDYVGIAAAAAGADSIGTGWHTAQRACSIDDWRTRTPGGQYIPYAPHPGMLARLRRAEGDQLHNLAADFARKMRWNQNIPVEEADERDQHLSALKTNIDAVITAGRGPTQRVAAARHILDGADIAWNHAVNLGAQGITATEKRRTVSGLRDGFEQYARGERL